MKCRKRRDEIRTAQSRWRGKSGLERRPDSPRASLGESAPSRRASLDGSQAPWIFQGAARFKVTCGIPGRYLYELGSTLRAPWPWLERQNEEQRSTVLAQLRDFVTRAEPSTVLAFPDVTYRRMNHAVTKVSEAATMDPHAIVKDLMSTFGAFNLGENPGNAWELASPGAVGGSAPIVRVRYRSLGVTGVHRRARGVMVYENLADGFPGEHFQGQVQRTMQLEVGALEADDLSRYWPGKCLRRVEWTTA